MDKSVNRFNDIGYKISYDESVVEHILKNIKGDEDYGARPIIRAVQNEIEDPLTDSILDGLDCNDINVKYEDDKIVIDCCY